MSDSNRDLTQALLDWDRIAADIEKDLEALMEAYFQAGNRDAYQPIALIYGKVKTARRVMLDSRSMATSMAPKPDRT